jgi:hypothetical protein
VFLSEKSTSLHKHTNLLESRVVDAQLEEAQVGRETRHLVLVKSIAEGSEGSGSVTSMHDELTNHGVVENRNFSSLSYSRVHAHCHVTSTAAGTRITSRQETPYVIGDYIYIYMVTNIEMVNGLMVFIFKVLPVVVCKGWGYKICV